MNRNLFWKFALILFILAWALWEIYPPSGTNLVTEFQNEAVNTDTNFNQIVEKAHQLETEFPKRSFVNLREAIGSNDVTRYFPSIKLPAAETDPTRGVLQRLQADAAGKIKLGLDLQGGSSFLVKMETNKLTEAEARDRALSQAIEVLRKRVDKFGVAEPIIQPVGSDEILIQMPGLSEAEMEAARVQLKKPAFLEFRLVHPRSSELLTQGLGAPGYELLRTVRKGRDGKETVASYLVKKGAEKGLTGAFVSSAMVTQNPLTGQPEIVLKFNSKGTDLFGEVTQQHQGEQLAIVLDGELYSAPVIKTAILDGNASIEGDFTIGEAYSLANVLQNPLETPVRIVQENTVDPLLGKDSIRSGIKASIIGTLAVAGFMLGYYILAGVLADAALMLNIVILLGVMCSIETTLTLPGIAGIVLTVGMAVDANVLIFERIREELEAGKSIRGAISSGYDKAFGTIFDSNLTTLISSVILIFMGAGPVKGFGVTLTIGVIVSMFTALVVTRLAFDWMLARNWLKSLKMMRLINPTHLDFLKWSKMAFVLSWSLVLIGGAYGIYRGKDTLGVDFRGGDAQMLTYAAKAEVGAVRKALQQAGIDDAIIQYQKDQVGGQEVLQLTTPFGTSEKANQILTQQFPNSKFHSIGTNRVGGTVSNQILETALVATLLSLFGILIYVAMRYEFSFAIGAVIAIIHDVFMTLGWFCLTGRQFSAPMVAAVLTIIGFSINDTIVIFDRIREDLRLGVRGTFKELMNHALNRTLSRTIITSGTVFLSTLSLYLFGGPVINDFAFTFLVGILTGTYSSIYIACAIVLWWHKGERPKTSTQVMVDQTATAKV